MLVKVKLNRKQVEIAINSRKEPEIVLTPDQVDRVARAIEKNEDEILNS